MSVGLLRRLRIQMPLQSCGAKDQEERGERFERELVHPSFLEVPPVHLLVATNDLRQRFSQKHHGADAVVP